MDISERKRTILTALMTIHTNSGDPVGSHILSHFLDTVSVSTATLRNEMAEMTTLGLLYQPHTSAGRVPTQLGIRYYIDNLMNLWAMESSEKEYIRRIIEGMDSDPEKATETAVQVLSELFSLSSIAMTPRGSNPHLVHFNLLKTGKYNYALIGITNAGSIQSRVSRTPLDLSLEQLNSIENVFNKHLVFISPEDVNDELIAKVNNDIPNYTDKLSNLVSSALSLIESLTAYRIYSDGEQNLLSFREMYSQIVPYLRYINDTKRVPAILMKSSNPISIYLGEEIDSSLSGMGMVTGHFRAGRLSGHLAVAGPVRMNYAYIVPRLKFFCDTLSEILSE